MVRMAVQPDGKIVLAGFTGDPTRPFALARFTPQGRLDLRFGDSGRIVHPSVGTAGPEFAKGVGAHLGTRQAGCGLALQPDGKIVVAAHGTLHGKEGFAVGRFLPDGRPDSRASRALPAARRGDRFDPDGRVDVEVGKSPVVHGLVLQPDNKIVVAGALETEVEGNRDFFIVRLEGSGAMDAGFGQDARVIVDFDQSDELAYALALEPGGKLLVGGSSRSRMALLRCNPDGSLDESFGKQGKVLTEFRRGGAVYCLQPQPGGQILALGSVMVRGWDLALGRYRTDGSPDDALVKGGWTHADVFGDEEWYAMVALPDGKVLAAGNSGRGPHGFADADFAAVCSLPDGSLDRKFGQDGKVQIDFFGDCDKATALARQPGNKILLAGVARAPDGVRLALACLAEDGRLEPSFGKEGKVSVPLSANGAAGAVRMVLQPDGKIVLAGFTGDELHPFALARFHPDGRLDRAFGNDGRVISPNVRLTDDDFEKVVWQPFGGRAWGCGLALQGDGKIVVAARGRTGDRAVVAVARYRSDGRPDVGIGVSAPASVPGLGRED
jgi:uncharacterized delta-60 repeat protein